MERKKKIIISVLVVFLIGAVIVGSTYAYFKFTTGSGNTSAGTGKLDIAYNISNSSVTGTLIPSATRSGGISTSVTAKLNSGSEDGAINIYVNPTSVVGFPISALSYSVDVVDTSNNILNSYNGNFSTATVNTPYKIVDAYDLTTNLLTFNIYIWLNGATLTNENFSSTNSFTGVISADSVHITGEFEGAVLPSPQTPQNLFDPGLSLDINGYINVSSMMILDNRNVATYSSSYISVKPNTTYTITKALSNSFRIGTTATEPAINTSVIQTDANHNGTSMTITTAANAHYLFLTYMYCYNNSVCEYNNDTIRNSIVIVENDASSSPISNVTRSLNASSIVALPDIYNNGHGWTCTGLAYDDSTDTFLVGDIGKTLPSSSGFASQIVRVSHDFSTVIEQIPLYTTFSNMSDIQGITIDTSDGSIWFCSTSENLIRHIDLEGNSLGSFSVSGQPTGIVYSPSDDTFWILTYGSTNNIKHVGKTGTVLEQYTFNYNETLDQCFLDSQNGYLYITAGANYSSTNNVYLFNTITHEQSIAYEVDSYSVEGIWIGNNEMIIVNDGYYHSAYSNVNQANFYTLS